MIEKLYLTEFIPDCKLALIRQGLKASFNINQEHNCAPMERKVLDNECNT